MQTVLKFNIASIGLALSDIKSNKKINRSFPSFRNQTINLNFNVYEHNDVTHLSEI